MAVSENNLGVTSSPGDVDDFQVYFEAGQVALGRANARQSAMPRCSSAW